MSALAPAAQRSAQTAAAPNREPVSPELVLVDPELARAERARLSERARIEALVDVATLRRVAAAHAQEAASEELLTELAARIFLTPAKRRALRTACLLGVFPLGLFLAVHVARPPAPIAQHADARATPASGPRTLKAAVEQRVISLVLGTERQKLPPQLIDSSTGLVRNNVQAVCQHGTGSNAYLCVVRLAAAAPGAGLYIRYRRERDGREVLEWYGRRRG